MCAWLDVRFINQVRVEPSNGPPIVCGGDSGSPVVSATKEPLGLVFFGDGQGGTFLIMNPIPSVLQALGVQIF